MFISWKFTVKHEGIKNNCVYQKKCVKMCAKFIKLYPILLSMMFQVVRFGGAFIKTTDNVCPPYSTESFRVTEPFKTCKETARRGLQFTHPDQNKNTPQILETYGYPYETHNVSTKDNYILTVYRIIGSPNRKMQPRKRYPVFLQHGIALASDSWNFQPGNRNLPFKLADAGFEVWMGNSRGTTYSLGHKIYKVGKHLQYWNFSFHEKGLFDLPAVIHRILSTTGADQIFFIGHSMGSTQMLIALSEIPEINKLVHAAFLLAPVAYMGHAYGLARVVAPITTSHSMFQTVNLALKGRFGIPHQELGFYNISLSNFCTPTALHCGVCKIAIFQFVGYNAPQIDPMEISNIVAKSGNTNSIKTYFHYGQLLNSCKFRQYDYGADLNLEKYGSLEPPDYKLENIRSPLYMYYGERDYFATAPDVNMTASRLAPGVLKELYKVDDELFSHDDFLFAKDADKLIYNRILNNMEQILQEN